MTMTRGALAALLITCACSTHAQDVLPDASPDAPPDAAVPTYTPPQIPDRGGPVLAAPALVTVTWPGDALATDLHAFDGWYVTSDPWLATLAQYHVGAGSAAAWTAPTAAPATLDDTDLQLFLRDAIEHGTLAAPTADTLYTIYPPATTTITQTFGTVVYRSCETFQGYHGATTLTDGTRVSYAVAARCAAPSGFSVLDAVTWGASHEIAEAATDPDPQQHPAWQLPYDPAHAYLAPFGGEIGDLCEGYPLRIQNHMITALYSNAAAASFSRTCVPAPPGPMFAAASDVHALALTPGGTATATIRIVSSDPAASHLTFVAYSIPQIAITISPATATVAANDELAIQLAMPAATPAGQYPIVLQVRDPSYVSMTYLLVGQ